MARIDKYEDVLAETKILSEMHLPLKNSNNLYSIYPYNKQKLLWYLSTWDRMEARIDPNNKDRIIYNSKVFPYHGLHRSILVTRTPHLKAKEGYKIKFCNDLFVEMVQKYELRFNDQKISEGNNVSLKFLLRSDLEWSKYRKEVGNNKRLTSWSNEIDRVNISIKIPWTYSKDRSDYFPLFLCGNSNKLEHIIEYKLELSKLLHIMDSNGQTVEFSPELFDIIEDTSIAIPEMEGLYTSQTESEYKANIASIKSGKREYFVEDTKYIEDENTTKLGQKRPLSIDKDHNYPSNSLFWGAINVTKSLSNKSLTLYSSKPFNSPVKSTTIKTNISTLIENKDSYKTEYAYMCGLLQNVSEEAGYNFWKNNVLAVLDNKKFTPSLCFGGGKVIINLDTEQDCNDDFLPFCVINYNRKFIFKNFPTTTEDRLKFGATIEFDEE